MVTRAAPSPWRRSLGSSRPTLGSDIQKTRPNEHLRTVIVAPMTTAGRAYPWRVPCRVQRRSGFVALDQLRTVDAERLVGRREQQSITTVFRQFQEMFAE